MNNIDKVIDLLRNTSIFTTELMTDDGKEKKTIFYITQEARDAMINKIIQAINKNNE